MNMTRDTILLVEDQEINRKMVRRQLEDTYEIIEAENGQIALDIVKKNHKIGVILLDLVMPVMDGFEFLNQLKEIGQSAIPVLVMTSADDVKVEEEVLSAGAIDYVQKPVNRQILRSRIENAMIRNQMVLLQRMEFIASHDSLTHLYNRAKMFTATRKMLDDNREISFAFVRFDIDKFRMYNSAMGEAEGNRLLEYIAGAVRRIAAVYKICTYGRIDADVFCMCIPYDESRLMDHIKKAQEELNSYRPDYSLTSSTGIYVIDKPTLSVETIFTRASMASDKCKNSYNEHYAYYDISMSEKIMVEQKIANEMNGALENEQFEVYLQPKYDLNTDLPCGAEALVRWNHPTHGMVSPGKFIPVFEQNGFIATLDYYMWEHVCALIHRWLKQGKKVSPVSVNMSRVSLFNRHVDELVIGLVKKYQIPPELLQLEITESAYMANPEMMGETIDRLHQAGFIILMDDFGSGYSSLNTLKEIEIDILKLDMKFMPNGQDNGKSERILSSIVRMAGWLGMEVIAEGVETVEQKQFLESIGCGYVQGYYYARPMPVGEYEKIMQTNVSMIGLKQLDTESENLSKAVWSSNPMIDNLLSGIDIPVVLLEYASSHSKIVRTNQAYLEKYGKSAGKNIYGNLSKEDELMVSKKLEETSQTGRTTQCEFSYIAKDGVCHWLRMRTRRMATIPKSAIICCLIEEITNEKLFESRLARLVGTIDDMTDKKTMLIIDDVDVSRAVLCAMFSDRYRILEAENGRVGLQILEQHASETAIVLLDLVMPEMDGAEFLKNKNQTPDLCEIPVVVISAESDTATQLGMLQNGVSDYITKPFDLDITRQRVENALSYQSRFRQLINEYKEVKHKYGVEKVE